MNDLVHRLNVMSSGISDEAADRIEELEAALRKAQEALDWHSDEKSRAAIAEIEKVLK